MRVTAHERHSARQVLEEQFDVVGYNYRMTDIHAAIGLAQLQKLETYNSTRIENATYLTQNLEGVIAPACPEGRRHVYHQYTVRVPAGRRDGPRDGSVLHQLDQVQGDGLVVHLDPAGQPECHSTERVVQDQERVARGHARLDGASAGDEVDTGLNRWKQGAGSFQHALGVQSVGGGGTAHAAARDAVVAGQLRGGGGDQAGLDRAEGDGVHPDARSERFGGRRGERRHLGAIERG